VRHTKLAESAGVKAADGSLGRHTAPTVRRKDDQNDVVGDATEVADSNSWLRLVVGFDRRDRRGSRLWSSRDADPVPARHVATTRCDAVAATGDRQRRLGDWVGRRGAGQPDGGGPRDR